MKHFEVFKRLALRLDKENHKNIFFYSYDISKNDYPLGNTFRDVGFYLFQYKNK